MDDTNFKANLENKALQSRNPQLIIGWKTRLASLKNLNDFANILHQIPRLVIDDPMHVTQELWLIQLSFYNWILLLHCGSILHGSFRRGAVLFRPLQSLRLSPRDPVAGIPSCYLSCLIFNTAPLQWMPKKFASDRFWMANLRSVTSVLLTAFRGRLSKKYPAPFWFWA